MNGCYALIVVGLYIEMAASYCFAAQYLQISDIRQTLGVLPSVDRRNVYVRRLAYIWMISFVFGAVFAFLDDELYYEKFQANRLCTDLLISQVGYWSTFYICGIWNWMALMYQQAYMSAVYPPLGTSSGGVHNKDDPGVADDLQKLNPGKGCCDR